MSQGIPAKATLILLEEGITITRIAGDLGITKQAVSHHLRGKSNTLNDELLDWISANLKPDTALEVLDAVRRSRTA